MTFTSENTEGFSDVDLDILNNVADRLKNWFPGVDEKNIADAITNNWLPNISENDLYLASAKSLIS